MVTGRPSTTAVCDTRRPMPVTSGSAIVAPTVARRSSALKPSSGDDDQVYPHRSGPSTNSSRLWANHAVEVSPISVTAAAPSVDRRSARGQRIHRSDHRSRANPGERRGDMREGASIGVLYARRTRGNPHGDAQHHERHHRRSGDEHRHIEAGAAVRAPLLEPGRQETTLSEHGNGDRHHRGADGSDRDRRRVKRPPPATRRTERGSVDVAANGARRGQRQTRRAAPR